MTETDTPISDTTPKAKPVAAKPAKAVRAPVKAPIVAAPRKVAAKTKTVAAKTATKPIPAAPVRTANLSKDAKMTKETLFADLNDRAKGAMEKSTKAVEELTAFGKGNIEALVESSKIAAKNIETLGQDAADYAKTSFESATAAAKSFAAVKSPTEFMALQSDYARSAFDALIAESSRSTEKLLKMFGEIAQPISNRVSVATEKMKIVA